MGDMGDDFKAYREQRKELRARYGVDCPKCKVQRPRAFASILLPQQKCRVDGYRDQRPALTNEQRQCP